MLEWLRNRLRKWLAEEDLSTIEFASGTIDIVNPGRVMGATGMYLRVLTDHGEMLIGADQSINKGKFWRIWDHLRKDDIVEWEN